jgi:cell division protein FtsB
MSVVRSLKRRLRAAIPAAIFLALASYFAWHATTGTLGLRAYAARRKDLAAADAALAAAQAEQADWSNRVAGLQPDHLDADALDERARQMLNLSAPDELIVPVKNR